ncbi:rRNA pseudouridine synthase [Candidatus Saccharibacteria bacterium]|nr:rRNA pseudouridine synthase [Candidatus Saccharibacteria bacterium]
MSEDKVRLNKYLSTNFGISRREADELISAGKVLVNKKVAELGARVGDNDEVSIAGKNIQKEELRYFALNKPTGYVCSKKRQGDTPTIYELLPKELQNLKNVGRLDKDSSGILLLTNDGDFAFEMTHPKFHKTKVYEVEIDRDLAPLHQQMISDFGVTLTDGKSQLGLEKLDTDDKRKKWRVTMSEGRNRQIRRTFDALGYKVVKLHRVSFGIYSLSGLKPGEYVEFKKPR